MTLPQSIVRDVGGEVWTYAPIRPGANPVVVVRNGQGTDIVASAVATVDAVNTTLNGAHGLGVRTLTLTAVTDVISGRRYRLGPADPTTAVGPHEDVTVLSVAGFVATLHRPTRYAHATLTPFAGTRMSRTVTAAQAASLFWDGYARWSWDAMPAWLPRWDTGVECVRHQIVRLCTMEEWTAHDPLAHLYLSGDSNPEVLLDTAFQSAMLALGGKFRANTTRGSDAFVRATAMRASLDARIHNRADAEEIARWRERYETALAEVQVWPADLDQDGVVEDHERVPSLWEAKLSRA